MYLSHTVTAIFRKLPLRTLHSLTRVPGMLLLLTACGNEPADNAADEAAGTAASATGTADACVLLPNTVVQEVLGEAVSGNLALAVPGTGGALALSQCNYATATNPVAASLMLRRSTGGETAAAASTSVRQTLSESGVAVQEITGLAEIAFWGGNQLHVFAGDQWYLIILPPASAGLEQATALAERALERL